MRSIVIVGFAALLASPAASSAKSGIKTLDPDYWANRRFILPEFHELEHAPKSPTLLRKLSEVERASIERARQRSAPAK